MSIRVDGGMVKLGIEAPSDVPVHRQEVYDEIQKNNQGAMTKGQRSVPRISKAAPSSEPPPAPPESHPTAHNKTNR
jgi:carbon storage regulator